MAAMHLFQYMCVHTKPCIYIVVGFAQTVFSGPERDQEYSVQAGFLSGRPDTGAEIVSNITLVDGSAGNAENH